MIMGGEVRSVFCFSEGSWGTIFLPIECLTDKETNIVPSMLCQALGSNALHALEDTLQKGHGDYFWQIEGKV